MYTRMDQSYICMYMCGRRITSGTLTRASAVFIPGACIPSHKKHVSLLSTAHNIHMCVFVCTSVIMLLLMLVWVTDANFWRLFTCVRFGGL